MSSAIPPGPYRSLQEEADDAQRRQSVYQEEQLAAAMATPINTLNEQENSNMKPIMTAANVYPGILPARPHDPFWSKDPAILIRTDRLMEFFPMPSFTKEEKLNALARFGLYLGAAISMYKKSPKFLYITAGTLLLTQFIYTNSSNSPTTTEEKTPLIPQIPPIAAGPEQLARHEQQRNIQQGNGPFTYPTNENPFMNVMLSDYTTDPARPRAVPYGENTTESLKIEKDIDEKYFEGLFRDASDIFGRDGGARQFYTMPSTTIPNNREAFQNWCYGEMPSCRDDPKQCFKYQDLRQQASYIPPLPPGTQQQSPSIPQTGSTTTTTPE